MKIPDQYLERVKQIIKDHPRYVLIAGVLAVLILDYGILLHPQVKTFMKVGKDVKELSTKVERTETEIKRLNIYRKQIVQLRADIQKVNEGFQLKDQIPIILEYVSRMANKSNIKIDQMMPDIGGQELILENDERKYFLLPILIEAQGGYHDFGRFLNAMETDDIFLEIFAFAMVARGDRNNHMLKLTLNVVVVEEV